MIATYKPSGLLRHLPRFFATLLHVLILPAVVQAQFSCTTDGGTIIITRYTGPGGAVAIPDTINGLPVTGVGAFAFASCPSMTSVTIPNSVTNIGSNAFYSCISLRSVTVPNSVTSIGDGAFASCISLRSVTVPNRVTGIGAFAFASCTSLRSVTVPTSVTSIGVGAFSACTSLTNVTIPTSVTGLGADAFRSCTNLTSVTIPNSVTSIGVGAFYGCTSLSAITVNALNPSYSSPDGVLFNKSQTLLVQYPGGKAGSYTIPNSVTSVGDAAFAYCFSLTSVTIPSSVTSIEHAAFFYCPSLTSVTIGDGVTRIGNYAFSGCTSLTSVTIPNSVTSIGDSTFAYCASLTGVYFQGNAPSVGLHVFEENTATIIYYLPGTAGWDSTFAGLPAVLWNPLANTGNASFGVRTNRFGFTISWASDKIVVVEACTNLADSAWVPVGTNTLTGGSSYFSDPEWTNHPARFYRLRSP